MRHPPISSSYKLPCADWPESDFLSINDCEAAWLGRYKYIFGVFIHSCCIPQLLGTAESLSSRLMRTFRVQPDVPLHPPSRSSTHPTPGTMENSDYKSHFRTLKMREWKYEIVFWDYVLCKFIFLVSKKILYESKSHAMQATKLYIFIELWISIIKATIISYEISLVTETLSVKKRNKDIDIE